MFCVHVLIPTSVGSSYFFEMTIVPYHMNSHNSPIIFNATSPFISHLNVEHCQSQLATRSFSSLHLRRHHTGIGEIFLIQSPLPRVGNLPSAHPVEVFLIIPQSQRDAEIDP